MIKKAVFNFLLVIAMVSCKKETAVVQATSNPIPATAVLKFSGTFMGANGYAVAGSAKIFQDGTAFSLSLENFNSSSGPDLKVYLSKQESPTEFISLGALKSTNGTQNYIISGSPDFSTYKYIIVHCQQFNRVFGRAELK